MNEWDIQEAVQRYAKHPVLSKATILLKDLMELTNQVSDGWPYWTKPCHAANKLIELVQAAEDDRYKSVKSKEPTEADLRKAVAPIKAFMTKNKRDGWPELKFPC